MKKNKYYSPSVSVEEVKIEKGFAASNGGTMGDGPMTETEGGWAETY